jgi:hypothetical protein
MLSTTLNLGANWLILSVSLPASYRAYKFGVNHYWHIWSFTTIQLHLQVGATDVNFAIHFVETYSEYPLIQGHTFSSNSSRGLLCFIDILNYFSVIYACNT